MPEMFDSIGELEDYILSLDTNKMAILVWVQPDTKEHMNQHLGHTMSLEASGDITRLHCYDCNHDVLGFWERPEENLEGGDVTA